MTINRETGIQRAIMLALSEAGCTVWRNNTAGAWIGRIVHRLGSQVTLADAHMITFGLCVGSSDIIGIAPDGRFLAVEVKTATGRATPEQQKFIEHVRSRGGIAGIARSPSDALALLANHRKGDQN